MTAWAGKAGRRTTNSLPRPKPRLEAVIVPPCNSTSAAPSRQADPHASLGTVHRPFSLCEQLEDVGQHLPRNAHPGVANADDGLLSFAPGRQPDMAAWPGVLRCIVQEVDDDLEQASRVSLQSQRLARQGDIDFVMTGLQMRFAHLDGVG